MRSRIAAGSLVLLPLLLSLSGPAHAACVADCDADGQVTSAEISSAIGSLLGLTVAPCAARDANGDGRVTVSDMVRATIRQRLGCSVAVTVSGRVTFDDGTPVVGATVVVGSQDDGAQSAAQAALVGVRTDDPVTGKPGALVAGVDGAVAMASSEARLVTNADGRFQVTLPPEELPVEVVVTVERVAPPDPTVSSGRTRTAELDVLDVGTILLPLPSASKMTLAAGSGATPSDDVRATLPPEVDAFYARSYDPSASPEAFPGEFEEVGGKFPLQAAQLTWAEAQDANGNSVDELSQPATIRGKLDQQQYGQLVDLDPGTDRIDVPVFRFDEGAQSWRQVSTGWLEDEAGTVLPEDAQDSILGGTYQGKLYATFTTDHLSWFSVAYPISGPFRLARLAPELRGDACFSEALRLATFMLRSRAMADAIRAVDPTQEALPFQGTPLLYDGGGPFVEAAMLSTSTGRDVVSQFLGDEAGERDDVISLDERLWGCVEPDDATRKNVTLAMAAGLVNAFAHLAWDVLGQDGSFVDAEPAGDAGYLIETTLFGGVVQPSQPLGAGPSSLLLGAVPMADATRDALVAPGTWPPSGGGSSPPVVLPSGSPSFSLGLALDASSYDLGAEITATVTVTNTGAQPAPLLVLDELEGRPAWFEIAPTTSLHRAPFLGARQKALVPPAAFIVLGPGQQHAATYTLLRDPNDASQRYQITTSGPHAVRVSLSPVWGTGLVTSNIVPFLVGEGASLAGRITDATTGDGIAGASVEVRRAGLLLGSATTAPDGTYAVDGLAPGSETTVEAQATGYLRSHVDHVTLAIGAPAAVDLSLSPLLSAGALRIVLTWGSDPNDLDLHAWLPTDRAHHVYYTRRGHPGVCPFTRLDLDDVDGFGPETLTIERLVGDGSYRVAVANPGAGSIAGSAARIQVIDDSGLIATFTPPALGTGHWWHVFELASDTGAITEINEIVEDAAPYYDQGNGCPHEQCDNGIDDDLDGLLDCDDGIDCYYSLACREFGPDLCANGIDDDENGLTDCADPYCHAEPACNERDECDTGADEDGDGDVDCEDSDCNNDPSCVEIDCADQADDEGDGLVDCADPDCAYLGDCFEHGHCHDGVDNDADTLVDCDDSDCVNPSTQQCGEYGSCENGTDDDDDGLTDCADPDCGYVVDCHERGNFCFDGQDNEGDGAVDCADSDCATTWCVETFAFNCTNVRDDDGDGLMDCLDPDCSATTACLEYGHCNDGVDNNANFAIDCLDAACYIDSKCSEVLFCSDDIDNDTDGPADCLDYDCVFSAPCRETGECQDAIDNDDDGAMDCADTDCYNDPACTELGSECGNDLDDDDDGMIDCADYDCFDDGTCRELGSECSNLVDDDDDGMIDCADYDCLETETALCTETDAECDDQADNDGDELMDCADFDCNTAAPCTETGDECVDEADNDGDQLFDCLDYDCYYEPACSETGDECLNGLDDDGDGSTDCFDYDCMEDQPEACSETGTECSNDVDDDGDGMTDCADGECYGNPDCVETGARCANEVDDDVDGAIDCLDYDCAGSPDCAETGARCTNGQDDDWNGFWDCYDPGCYQEAACTETDAECANELDDDGDGNADCADTDCTGSPDCTEAGARCSNGMDDDLDGLTDCDDTDCAGAPACV